MAANLWIQAKDRVRNALIRATGLHDKREFLRAMYASSDARRLPGTGYPIDARFTKSPPFQGGRPVPPWDLFVGYHHAPEAYLNSGKAAADSIRSMAEAQGVQFKGARVLDWGCAAGRVLRHFEADAEGGDFWGTDPAEDAIFWAGTNLSPPLRFVTCNQYPHLPFEDNYFDLIYGISVFTHVEYMVDTWLMELRRILKPGGVAIFTIHDESSLDHFEREGYPYFITPEKAAIARQHRCYVVRSTSWEYTLPIYRSEFIREWWGKFYDVLEIHPCAVDAFQTAVILGKR